MEIWKQIKKDLTNWFLIVCFVYAFYPPIADYFEWGWDDSDGEARSGLHIHADAKTGCEYLSTARGYLSPRYGTKCFAEIQAGRE